MFTYFTRILFSPLSLSLGPTLSAIPGDIDGNGTNIDEVIAAIGKDTKIDGSDDVLVNHLLDKLEVSNTEITDATRQEISTHLKKELETSVELGYTVLDETSYNTYTRLMNFLHPEIEIPLYNDIKSTLFASGAFKSTYSFVYNTQEKTIGIYRHDTHSSSGNIFAVIENGIVNKTFNPIVWDAFSNNNQFGLSEDIIDDTIPVDMGPLGPTSRPNNGKKLVEEEQLDPLPGVPVIPVTEGEPLTPPEPELEEAPKPDFVPPRRPISPTPEPKEEDIIIPETEEVPVVPQKPEQLEAPKPDFVPPRRPISPTPEVEKEDPKGDFYSVKKGDILWRIVRDHYGLTDNKTIGDTVNWVVESQKEAALKRQLERDTYGDNRPGVQDGIMGDVLNPGDIVYLPPLGDISQEQQSNNEK